MQRFKNAADNNSVVSRAASWGTRRRSGSFSGFDIPSSKDARKGLFIKIISKLKGKEKSQAESVFDQGLNRLANMVRKKSDSKLKRLRSVDNVSPEANDSERQRTLPPPARATSFVKRHTPSISTAIAAMAGPLATIGQSHLRNVSTSPTSPKGSEDLGFRNVVKRGRNLNDSTSYTGLEGLWKRAGGPPLPELASPPVAHSATSPFVHLATPPFVDSSPSSVPYLATPSSMNEGTPREANDGGKTANDED
jgi:hypothetical protein